MTEDRREEFANVPWRQGCLLETATTKQWPLAERCRAEQEERRQAFVSFHNDDEGRSRELVYVYDSADQCLDAVQEHNAALRRP